MGYIGRDNRVVSFTKQSFTANGVLTSFTLDYGVGDSSSILVSVGGVVQQPGVAYTASGTTLTFTAAPGIGTPVWVVYLGKELFSEKATVYSDSDSQIGVGNGTATPLTLSHSVTNPQSIIVTLNGVAQVPTTDFTVSGTTLTFTTAPDSTNDITIYYLELESSATYIPDGSITAAKLDSSGTIPAWNGSALTNLDAADLTGALPAIDGSSLTNQPGPVIKSASNPASNSNPSSGVGTLWLNHTTGQMYALTNATTNSNYWTNVGTGTGDILNNPPTNPNNTGSFQNINKNTSYQFTFSGATDPDAGDSVTHYHVDQISDGAVLSVSAASIAAGSAHTFTAGNVGSDTNITFRVRAKDSFGAYSSGVTVTMTVLNVIYTTATGGSITTIGDYKVHTFLGSGTFTVTQLGNLSGHDQFEYLVIAGGGSGGYSIGAGGGAGGLRNSYASETSGGGGSSESALTLQASAYTVIVGGGGVCTVASGSGGDYHGDDGTNSSFAGAGISTVTSLGGGRGGGGNVSNPYAGNGGNGGSGGGGGTSYGAGVSGQGYAGTGASGQGYAGGDDNPSDNTLMGGGGGAAAVGYSYNTGSPLGTGGAGLQCNIDGNNHYWAGGGGRGTYFSMAAGNGGIGGGGGGCQSNFSGPGTGGGSARNSGVNGNIEGSGNTPYTGGNGGLNTGGGGGGGGFIDTGGQGGKGGSGIVIVRYKFQN